MLVLVGTCVPVSGSVVLMPPPGPPVNVTLPCVCTDAAAGGTLMVASYLIVTLLPTFSTTGRLKEIVSPENGVTGFEADAIEFAADGALARPRGPRPSISAGVGRSGRAPPDSITDSEPLLMRGLMPRSTGASLLRRKFKFAAKAATGCRTSCLSHANVVG